ncbi:MAG: hypothetical protein HRU46_01000 [Verrucomicrobiales bacterium]|nr:hypothetical protein [Verrucomicrobiales bacterium]
MISFVVEMTRGIASQTSNSTRVTLLTCRLAPNNHTIVRSHYKRHRVSLLRAGSALLELRGDPSWGTQKLSNVLPI